MKQRLLRAAALFAAVLFLNMAQGASPKGAAVLESIMTRSSVRSYTSQPVEDEKIEIMLRAAMAAPTALNRQPWEFLVIRDRATLDKLPSIVKGSRSAGAQLAIMVLGTPAKAASPGSWIMDCSNASMNILHAAHAMGLGAVWCGAYSDAKDERVGQLAELLSIPEGTYALNVIVIGYPDREPEIKDKWAPEKIHYDRYR